MHDYGDAVQIQEGTQEIAQTPAEVTAQTQKGWALPFLPPQNNVKKVVKLQPRTSVVP